TAAGPRSGRAPISARSIRRAFARPVALSQIHPRSIASSSSAPMRKNTPANSNSSCSTSANHSSGVHDPKVPPSPQMIRRPCCARCYDAERKTQSSRGLEPPDGLLNTRSVKPTMVQRAARPFKALFVSDAFAGILLIAVAVLAIASANSAFADEYHRLFHAPLPWTPIAKLDTAHLWINDALMAVFFF